MIIFIAFILITGFLLYILYYAYGAQTVIKIISPYIPGTITAVGLAITMWKLSSAFSSAKELNQEIIKELIPKIANALFISFIAICTAIIVTIISRILFSNLEKKRVQDAPNQDIYQKPEKVLYDMAQNNIKFHEQSASFHQNFVLFHHDFKEYMQNQEKANRALKDELSYVKEAIISEKNEIKNIFYNIEKQTLRLETIFINLLNNIQHGVKSSFKDIYKISLNQIEESLEKISEQQNQKFFTFLQSQYQETEKSMQEMMQNLKNIADNTEKLFNNTIEQQQQLLKQNETQFLEQHNKINEKLLAQQENMQQNLQTTLQKLESITENVENILAQSTQAQNEIITQQQKNLQEALSELQNEHIQNIRNISSETHVNLQKLSHSIQHFDTQFTFQAENILQNHINNIERLFEKINEWNEINKIQTQAMQIEFKRIFENQQNLNHNEKELAQEMQRQIEAIKTTNESIKILLMQQQEFVSHVDQLQHRVGEIANTITTLDTLNEKLSKIYVQETE